MSVWKRIFGGGEAGAGAGGDAGDTETVRRIGARLDGLPRERRRFVAAFAYVLARVARADLDISSEESEKMIALVRACSSLS